MRGASQRPADSLRLRTRRGKEKTSKAGDAKSGGSRNGGNYCFETVPEPPEGTYGFGSSFIAYIDGEDPTRCVRRSLPCHAQPTELRRLDDPPAVGTRVSSHDCRSSWCRYLNHAPARECNLEIFVDARVPLIWFVARRNVQVGEELHFNYGKHYRWES